MKTTDPKTSLGWALFPILALLLLASGCASHQPSRSPLTTPTTANVPVSGTILTAGKRGQVRSDEALKAYPINRYVDPIDPDVMHEGHVIYRKESGAAWNLAPQESGASIEPILPFSDPDPLPTADTEPRSGVPAHLMSALVEENEVLMDEVAQLKKTLAELRPETAPIVNPDPLLPPVSKVDPQPAPIPLPTPGTTPAPVAPVATPLPIKTAFIPASSLVPPGPIPSGELLPALNPPAKPVLTPTPALPPAKPASTPTRAVVPPSSSKIVVTNLSLASPPPATMTLASNQRLAGDSLLLAPPRLNFPSQNNAWPTSAWRPAPKASPAPNSSPVPPGKSSPTTPTPK